MPTPGRPPAASDRPADDESAYQDAESRENAVPEPTATEPEQSEQARELQEENAESSLDQPSQ
jgi:hypothetical protein